jgi:hypothetical protein
MNGFHSKNRETNKQTNNIDPLMVLSAFLTLIKDCDLRRIQTKSKKSNFGHCGTLPIRFVILMLVQMMKSIVLRLVLSFAFVDLRPDKVENIGFMVLCRSGILMTKTPKNPYFDPAKVTCWIARFRSF